MTLQHNTSNPLVAIGPGNKMITRKYGTSGKQKYIYILSVSDCYSVYWRQCMENKEKGVQKEEKRKKTMSTRLSRQDVKAAPTQNIMFVPLLHRGQ